MSVTGAGSGGNSSTQHTSVQTTQTTAGANSPATNNGGAILGGTSPVLVAKTGSKITYNVPAPVVTPTVNTDVINSLNTSVAAALSALADANKTSTQTAANVIPQVTEADQKIAASGASGGQTDFQATILKIVYAVLGAVVVAVSVPFLIGMFKKKPKAA